ncbi:hypothetical protein [Paenibacillus guangzhouensis]|uniref:hypothetical protein n=1 Tax=Paenibacillus guangzhouensis TaxID=1473112 RepID=UPI001266AC2A|nr:hypothetical protein [Paenibacillus guangzhouensis]
MVNDSKKEQVRKKWWEPKSTGILRQFAHVYHGTYHASALKSFSYTPQHALVNSRKSAGEIKVIIIESGNSGGSADTVEISYEFRPRRKLEFTLLPTKRMASWLQRLRPTSMPNSAMAKLYRGSSSHPSIFRSVLKHEQLQDKLLEHPDAELKLSIKDHKAKLTYRERIKKLEEHQIAAGVELMEQFISALRDQSVIYETR